MSEYMEKKDDRRRAEDEAGDKAEPDRDSDAGEMMDICTVNAEDKVKENEEKEMNGKGLSDERMETHQETRQETRQKDGSQVNGSASLYSELDKFTDTVLFEYRLGDGAIFFTPNASKQIEIPVLKHALEKYVKCPPEPEEIRSFELRLKTDSREYRWCICHIRAEYDGQKIPIRLIGKLDDISKQKAREEQLLFQSTRDGLTGVYNKTAFEYVMEETLKKGSRGFLYMFDIDNFKDVNDQYGHPAGDKILIKIGELLREFFRDSDLIGRVGGDEFVVYSENGETKEKASKLLKAIADFIPEEGKQISVSIGIAASTGDADEEYHELFSRADQAMYRAKQEGKNRIACYGE